MKITIVLGAFLPVPPIMGGAVEKAWFVLAGEFAKRGHEVTVVSRAVREFPKDEVRDGVRHLRVAGFDTPGSLLWLKVLDLIYSIRVTRMVGKQMPNAERPTPNASMIEAAAPQSAINHQPSTINHDSKADVLVTNTFWLPILLRCSKPGRVYVHVARFPKGQMRFYGRAARLQAPSRVVAEAIAKEAPGLASKVKVIPYPAPAPVSREEPPPSTARLKTILYVGRVHPEKGVHLLVEAFAGGARTVFAEWKLMIVGPTEEKFGGGGDSYLASLRRASETATTQVEFTGGVFDSSALEAHFRGARVFVYPSLADRGESFGLAPLEAMTHRCAVIVSNLDCFRDFIRDGETGFAFDHHVADPVAALQRRIQDVVTDETLLARAADAGYRKSAEYALPQVAEQFLNDFNSLSKNGGHTDR